MGTSRRAGDTMSEKSYLRLDGYSMPNPNHQPYSDALWTARYSLKNLTQTQAYLLCQLGETYITLMMHPAGTEAMIKKVRDVRRALREKK